MKCCNDDGVQVTINLFSIHGTMLTPQRLASLTSSTAGLSHHGMALSSMAFFQNHPSLRQQTTTTLMALPIAEMFAAGSSQTPMLDMSRVGMRLEGIQVYATLAALLTNACLELYSNIRIPEDEKEETTSSTAEKQKKRRKHNWAIEAFLLCTAVSVLFGSYTTIVFGLFSILSKTALGRGLDIEFLEFWAQSASIRNSGFESFLCSLICFELSFVLSLFLKFKGRRRQYLVTLATVIFLLSVRRWTSLLHLASKLLFPLYAEAEY